MTREDIIRMALEAGFMADSYLLNPPSDYKNQLERFAALVAAHEREECAKLCDAFSKLLTLNPTISDCATAIRARGGK